jgi:hypothetical protein
MLEGSTTLSDVREHASVFGTLQAFIVNAVNSLVGSVYASHCTTRGRPQI